jgi:hypothetical protein
MKKIILSIILTGFMSSVSAEQFNQHSSQGGENRFGNQHFNHKSFAGEGRNRYSPIPAVPEPNSSLMIAVGLVLMVFIVRRRTR